MNPSGEGDPAEGKRLLELVAFAQRDQDSWRFTWRHGVFFGLAVLSLFAALRAWTTWRSFHRPIEVRASPDISAAEQGVLFGAIRTSTPWALDPVVMDAATFQNVLLGRGRVERSVNIIREGREVRVTVYRSDGNPHSARWPYKWDFTFGESGRLVRSSGGFRDRPMF